MVFYSVKYPNATKLTEFLVPKIKDQIDITHNYFRNMKNDGICCMIESEYPGFIPKLKLDNDCDSYLIDLKQFIVQEAAKYSKNANINIGLTPYISALAISYYPPGAFFDYHCHHVPQVAVVYLLKKENAGNFWFKDENDIEEEVITSEGDLLIFPGNLKHKTTPNLSDDLRMVIALDIDYR